MKKLILTAVVFLIFLFSLKAQIKQSEVVSSSSGSAQLGANTIEWTMGETIVGTVSTSETTLTQGFNQSYILNVTTAIDIPNVEVSVYPNPTAHYLQVSIQNLIDVEFNLINLQGHVLLNKVKPESDLSTIDMSSYPSGIYMLEILDLISRQKEIIKILKK